MNIDVRQLWLRIEDFSVINAIFLYGLLFTNALYLVGKFAVKYKGLTTFSNVRALFTIFQMTRLAISGSRVITKWQEIKILSQELFISSENCMTKSEAKMCSFCCLLLMPQKMTYVLHALVFSY